jgi:two-component system cell cycle sensor histidine kinase/response regulator CckA
MTCILVVEDDDAIRDMMVEVLCHEGFRTIEASSADTAVELLQTPGLWLIVTDINMPGRLDGIDLAIAARNVRPNIPVIFISGRFTRLAEASCAISDHTAFLQKPFTFAALIKNIERFVTVD